jgi:hypothetical protein
LSFQEEPSTRNAGLESIFSGQGKANSTAAAGVQLNEAARHRTAGRAVKPDARAIVAVTKYSLDGLRAERSGD